jgi:hypothetical protein
MSTTTLHPAAADYLRRLRRAGRRLPRSRLKELVQEVEAHLTEAIPPGASDADALTVLDRLGEPDEIVEAEQPQPVSVQTTRGVHEWAAIFLLLFGGFVFGFGWVAGLILLWSSRAWTNRDKWIGTLLIPGGLAATIYVGLFAVGTTAQSCSGGLGLRENCTGGFSPGASVISILVLAILILTPIATSIYLARRAQ